MPYQHQYKHTQTKKTQTKKTTGAAHPHVSQDGGSATYLPSVGSPLIARHHAYRGGPHDGYGLGHGPGHGSLGPPQYRSSDYHKPAGGYSSAQSGGENFGSGDVYHNSNNLKKISAKKPTSATYANTKKKQQQQLSKGSSKKQAKGKKSNNNNDLTNSEEDLDATDDELLYEGDGNETNFLRYDSASSILGASDTSDTGHGSSNLNDKKATRKGRRPNSKKIDGTFRFYLF